MVEPVEIPAKLIYGKSTFDINGSDEDSYITFKLTRGELSDADNDAIRAIYNSIGTYRTPVIKVKFIVPKNLKETTAAALAEKLNLAVANGKTTAAGKVKFTATKTELQDSDITIKTFGVKVLYAGAKIDEIISVPTTNTANDVTFVTDLFKVGKKSGSAAASNANATSYSVTAKDGGNGVWGAAYAVVEYKGNEYTVWSDAVMLKADSEAVKLITATSKAESIPSNKIRIIINTNSDDINPVVRTGAIVFRGNECPPIMTRESAATDKDIFDVYLDGKSYSKAFTDTYNSVYYVGYVVLSDGTVVYDEIKHTGMYEFICAEESSTVEIVADNKIRIIVKAKGILANNVTRTGAIVFRGEPCTEDSTIETAAEKDDIFDLSLAGKSYSKAFTDTYDSVYYVGYVIYNDGTVIYGDLMHTSMSELKSLT